MSINSARKAQLISRSVIFNLTAAVFSACALVNPVQPAPTAGPANAHTQAAESIVARVTQGTPTETPRPSATLAPNTFTPTPTSVGADTATPVPTDAQLSTESPQPTDTAESFETQPPTAINGDFTIVLRDEFSGDSGWYTLEEDIFGFEYAQGGYRIYVNLLDTPIWSVRQRELADVRLEVDVSRTGGPENGYFGVVCRFNQEERNYYALVISGDGSYAIARTENNEFEFIQEGAAPAGVIKSGDAANRVVADCMGDTLTLSANGQQLASIEDGDFETGWIGLIAGTRDQPGIVALFDNLIVLKP
jgi:hypothetical protein